MDKMITSIDELDPELFMRGQVEEALRISNNNIEFLSYSHADTSGGGVHVFCYEIKSYVEDNIVKNYLIDKEWEALKEFFEKDDDSQPHGLCRMWLDYIWHMVPYGE